MCLLQKIQLSVNILKLLKQTYVCYNMGVEMRCVCVVYCVYALGRSGAIRRLGNTLKICVKRAQAAVAKIVKLRVCAPLLFGLLEHAVCENESGTRASSADIFKSDHTNVNLPHTHTTHTPSEHK